MAEDRPRRPNAGVPPPGLADYFLERDPQYHQDESGAVGGARPRDDDERSLGGASLRSNNSDVARLDAKHDQKITDQKIQFLKQRLELKRKREEEEMKFILEMEELSIQKLKAEYKEERAALDTDWSIGSENNSTSNNQAETGINPTTPLDQITPPTNLFDTTSFGLGYRPLDTGMQSTPHPFPRRTHPFGILNLPPPIHPKNPAAVTFQERRLPDDGSFSQPFEFTRPSAGNGLKNPPSSGPNHDEASASAGNGLENPPSSGLNHELEDHRGDESHGPQQPGDPNDRDNNPNNNDASIAHLFTNVTSVLERLMERTESKPTVNQDKFLARQVFKYDLPQFNGNPLDWPMFKSTFENTTRECDYNHTANLARLQRCIKGDAHKLVRGMMTSPDNVPTILSKLERTYGRSELVVQTLIAEINAVACAREDKIETLMEFEAAVSSLVTTINSMKATEYLINPLLVRELEKKLSSTLKLNWAIHSGSNSRSLTEFSTWVSGIVDVMQPLHTPKFSSDKKNDAEKTKDKKEGKVLATTGSNPPSQPKQQNSQSSGKETCCPFCDDPEHRISKCPLVKKLDAEDRKRWALDNARCLNCVGLKHFAKDCTSKGRCLVRDCGKKHHTLFHGTEPFQPRRRENPELSIPQESNPSNEIPAGQIHYTHRDRVQYKVVPVEVLAPGNKSRKIYAMLDDCSAFTMIESRLATELGLKGKKETVKVKVVGGDVRTVTSYTLRLTLRNLKTGDVFKLDEVNTFDKLDLDGGSFRKSDQLQFPHLNGLDLATFTNVRPQMLIGLMHADLITPSQVVLSDKPNEPIAGLTKLGWVVYGRMPKLPPNPTALRGSIHHLEMEPQPDLHQLVKQFFSTEDFGVKICPNPQSRDEARAEEVVSNTLRRVGDRFEVGLLWRNDDIILPPSREAALSRLKSMERKMDRNPTFAEKYCKKIQHYIDSNFVEKIPKEEIASKSPRIWYLPHFAVFKPDKPDKPRLVFDAAASVGKVSLNSCLLKGPDELTPLHDVLCKFRERKVAISADIREMFHQILVRKEDRDSQRFLWRAMNRDSPPEEYRMRVMTFGATCSPFCAQRVKNVNAQEWMEKFPRAADAIIHRHYVDNYLDSVDTADEAKQLQKEVFDISQHAGYHLCAWVSNNRSVMSSIPEELRSESQKLFTQKEELQQEKVLGFLWDPDKDKFKFSLSFSKVDPAILQGEIPTKRQALGLTMSLFDPPGFAALLTVRGKVILKKTWKHGVQWDEHLPEELHGEWRRWLKEVLAMKSFEVPRCYSPHFAHTNRLELHIFCDSSTLAFAAVGYWRIEVGNQFHTAFVEAKTRVTPVKPLSMPRSELQGAIMACRLKKSILNGHTIQPQRIYFWTDSQYVLRCLKMDGTRFQQFVACRVGELQEQTDVNDWRWISTKDNVADEATRVDKKIDVSPTSRWLSGPSFLSQPNSQWPDQPVVLRDLSPEEQLELKKQFVGVTIKVSDLFKVLNPLKYSNWMRLIRVTAWCLRVFSKTKPQRLVLQPNDLNGAEVWWWKEVQQQTYPRELKILRSGGEITDGDLKRYSPILDSNGVMRMQSRLRAANNIGLSVLDPVILPAKHPYTNLQIRHHHEKANHSGIDRVVNELKTKFVIPTLRAQVKRAWHECQYCKNQRAQPAPPKMGVLPTARLQTYQRPFTYTGLDYFGPMEVTVKRSREKRYGALFTCLVTRAVHVELASSLETDTCISAMRRFFARRGQPREIWSDNGLNFVGAERELREELAKMNQSNMENQLSTLGISWNFIPPHAAHMGGVWERMVRSIKTALYATLKERAPREETLRTLLAEAEYSVNCHPLAYVSEDPESPEILTPNHFLLGPDYKMFPPAKLTDRDLIPGKQWKIAQRLADHFWNRWIKEILPTLAQRSKWFNSQKPLSVGDIVLLIDENQPRSHWKKGRVIQVPQTKDGQTRWAIVKTEDSQYRRPAVKLVVLDVAAKIGWNSDSEEDTAVPDPTPKQVHFLQDPCDLRIVPKSPISLGLRQETEEMRSSGAYEDIMEDYILFSRFMKLRTAC